MGRKTAELFHRTEIHTFPFPSQVRDGDQVQLEAVLWITTFWSIRCLQRFPVVVWYVMVPIYSPGVKMERAFDCCAHHSLHLCAKKRNSTIDEMPDWSPLPTAALDLQCKCSLLWFSPSPLTYTGSEKESITERKNPMPVSQSLWVHVPGRCHFLSHHLWFSGFFHPLFRIDPKVRGPGVDEDIPFMNEYSKVSHSLHVGQLCVSVLILTHCKKLLWWGSRDALLCAIAICSFSTIMVNFPPWPWPV